MKGLQKIIYTVFTLLIFATNCFGATQNEVKQAIIKQAKEMGVEPAIVLSIAKTESSFRQEAMGAGGTVGVFQLLPATAKNMGLNAYDLSDNIKGGIQYYKNMYQKFGSMELAVASYNTGPEAIKRNNYKVPKYAQYFVNKIMADYRYYKSQNL